MPQISRSALVPFSAEQMYQLVNDVHSYPDFLPGCTGSRVLNATNNEMTAAVDVAKAGISKTLPRAIRCWITRASICNWSMARSAS